MAIELAFNVPPEAALAFFWAKGLRTSFAWQDIWQAEHEVAFTVAKMADLDLLRDVRDAVDRALAEGETFEQFRNQLEPVLQKAGWWGKKDQVDPTTGEIERVQLGSTRRLKTIFRTNLQTAYAAGEWAQIAETAASAPYLMYDAVDDNRVRPQHRAWDGTVLRWDDPWWSTHRPPNGWNCRCSTVQLNERDLTRYGLAVAKQAPPVKTREYINTRTGEAMAVPDGIDPGWAYNPGQARLAHVRQLHAEKQREFGDG